MPVGMKLKHILLKDQIYAVFVATCLFPIIYL